MPHKTAPKVDLSQKSRKLVEEIARQRSTEYRLVVRALLMLAMADGLGNNELARERQMDRVVVRKWRNRWLELAGKLKQAEASGISDRDLRDLILTGLSDLPRSGTPPKFTAEQIVQIVAVACEEPANSGRPVSHWTPSELAAEVVKRQIVESVSEMSARAKFLSDSEHRIRFVYTPKHCSNQQTNCAREFWSSSNTSTTHSRNRSSGHTRDDR